MVSLISLGMLITNCANK